MKPDFDLDKIGKREPFRIPDNFMENFEREIIRRNTIPSFSQRFRRFYLFASGIASAAAIVCLIYIGGSFESQPQGYASPEYTLADIDAGFANLSDNDQDFIIDIYDEDPFINY